MRIRKILGKSFIVLLIIAIVVIPLLLLESDIQSKASNDGWLSYYGGLFGSLIATFTSFYILNINRKDSEATEERNKKFQEARMMSLNRSVIHFDKIQYLYRNPNGTNYLKLKLHDENHIPLKSMDIEYIKIYKSDYDYKDYDAGQFIFDNCKSIDLEYTPEQINENNDIENEFYYAKVELKKNIKDILDKEFYKLEIAMKIANIHNVKIEQKYFVIMSYKKNDKGEKITEFTKHEGLDDYIIFENIHYFTNYENIKYTIDEK